MPGHVPDEKLESRFVRTLANLERAIGVLPVVLVFDNSDLARPCRLEAVYRDGKRIGP
jgi:predicted ABC-type ATPase